MTWREDILESHTLVRLCPFIPDGATTDLQTFSTQFSICVALIGAFDVVGSATTKPSPHPAVLRVNYPILHEPDVALTSTQPTTYGVCTHLRSIELTPGERRRGSRRG